jgi:hypothetical protein
LKGLVGLLVVVVALAAIALLAEGVAFGGAWFLHSRGQYDDEIAWLDALQPVMRWEAGIERTLARRNRERVERALQVDRIDRAVHMFRIARARHADRITDPELVTLGLETFHRAADRLVKHGRLSEAADWEDSMFVLGIRSPDPPQRYAALAGFMEGLDLRVRDGQPCAALARVQWAKRGLGGSVPGMANNVEEDLTVQCAQARREGR